MKTSKVLRLAKKRLDAYNSMGVCRAVIYAHYKDKANIGDKERVKEMVMQRIEPFGYATDWLAWHMLYPSKPVPESYYDITNKELLAMKRWTNMQSAQSLQAWRHAWVDRMIKEFEAEGD